MGNKVKHEWRCDIIYGGCNNQIPFRQPELSQHDHNSEQNENRICPKCGEEMFFDEVEMNGNYKISEVKK